MGVGPGPKIEVILRASANRSLTLLEDNRSVIEKIAGLSKLDIEPVQEDKPEQAMTAIIGPIEVYVPLRGLIEKDKEIDRLSKELSIADAELDRLDKKLSNKDFLEKAPQQVVDKEKGKQAEYQEKADKIRERIRQLELL
jgi:valyl-tRNA synthetase